MENMTNQFLDNARGIILSYA